MLLVLLLVFVAVWGCCVFVGCNVYCMLLRHCLVVVALRVADCLSMLVMVCRCSWSVVDVVRAVVCLLLLFVCA